MSEPNLAWVLPSLTPKQRARRAILRKTIKLAQRFERSIRPSRNERSAARRALEVVVYCHLIRAIQLSIGILDLKENPIQGALLRVFCETYVNLHYIECNPESSPTRAKNFADFSDVNRIRLLLEIAQYFPNVVEESRGNAKALREQLEAHKPRFQHQASDGGRPYWDWDRLSLPARVQAYAKEAKKKGRDGSAYTRIIPLYQETNSYVHSGMRSMEQSIERSGGIDVVRPRMRHARDLSAPLLSAGMLTDMMGACTRVFNVSAYDAELEKLWGKVRATK